jgi:hypothetical protein
MLFIFMEMSFRVYVVGLMAFNPAKFNSMNLLIKTDLIKLSEYPEVFYELKPNLDTWFSGARLRTNSSGMADREYDLQKPPQVHRTAVVGSSWTMGSGVDTGLAFESILEQKLNTDNEGPSYELLNFGVSQHGLAEILGSIRYRAMQWSPDLVMVTLTPYTVRLKPPAVTGMRDLPEQSNPALESWLLSKLDRRGRKGAFYLSCDCGYVWDSIEDEEFLAHLNLFFKQLRATVAESDTEVAVMWIAWQSPGKLEATIEAACEAYGFKYLPVYRGMDTAPDTPLDRKISRFDLHPNAASHQLIATSILQQMRTQGLVR